MAGMELTDEAGLNEQLVAGRLSIGRGVAEGWSMKIRPAHGLQR